MPAQTPLHFFKIHEALGKAMIDWGVGDELMKLYDDMGKATSAEACEKLFKRFIAPHVYSHETFEKFEFVDVV